MPNTSRALRAAALAAVIGTLGAIACGGDATSDDSRTTTILDVNLTLTSAEGCDVGGLDADFTGHAGVTATIEATAASSLTPEFTLYAPDFSTQLGGSHANGAGKAKMTIALTVAGVHHLTLCEASGKSGSVHVTVKEQLAGS